MYYSTAPRHLFFRILVTIYQIRPHQYLQKKLSQMQDGYLATIMNIFPARSSAQEEWVRKNNRSTAISSILPIQQAKNISERILKPWCNSMFNLEPETDSMWSKPSCQRYKKEPGDNTGLIWKVSKYLMDLKYRMWIWIETELSS